MPFHPAYDISPYSDQEILRMHQLHSKTLPSVQNRIVKQGQEGEEMFMCVSPTLPKPTQQDIFTAGGMEETDMEMEMDLDTTYPADDNKENIDPNAFAESFTLPSSHSMDISNQYDTNTIFGTPQKPKNRDEMQLTPVKDSVDRKKLDMMRRFGDILYQNDPYDHYHHHHHQSNTDEFYSPSVYIKPKPFKIYQDGGDMDITYEEPEDTHTGTKPQNQENNKLKSKYGLLTTTTSQQPTIAAGAADTEVTATPTSLPPQKLLHKTAKSKDIFTSPSLATSLRAQRKLEGLKSRFPRNMYENGKKRKDLVDMIRRGEGGVRLLERYGTEWTDRDVIDFEWEEFGGDGEVEMVE
ncbi:hypothetical protein AA313_de0207175 [Arthrobotrys entomopaga]|nr:hypothetical protein AA313_de0207175 [Arthrobotrys entomopaga]